MKNMKTLLSLFASFILTFTFLVSSCDIKNPVDGIEVRIKNIPRTTTIRVEFADAKTGQQILDKIDVKFGGPNAADVITVNNKTLTETSTNEGVVFFAVNDAKIPDAQNPVNVLVIANSTNYIPTSQLVGITKSGANYFTINMTNVSASQQPTGVETNAKNNVSSTNTSTGTSQPITVATNEGNPTQNGATLTVPQGTILKDASGNKLTGNVNARVTYFNPTEEQALKTFPGGLTVNTNTRGVGNFTSAGFTAVNLTVGGNRVEQFEGGNVSVAFDVPNEVFNPETGQKVKVGDKIPMWSYDEVNGTWKKEGDYTISAAKTKGGTKLRVVKNDIKHLSYYNLDWFYGNYCTYGRTFTVTASSCYTWLYETLYRKNADGTRTYWKEGWIYLGDGSGELTLLNAPQGVQAEVDLYDYPPSWGGRFIKTVFIDDLCNGPAMEISLECPCDGQPVEVNVEAVCKNSGNRLTQGTIDIEILKDGRWQYLGTLKDGYMKVDCLRFGSYSFRVYYDGKWYETTYEVNQTVNFVEVELDETIDLCK